ncbi:MAG: anthranilate synthase component I [Lachnospiraceae bacterium]|nr:anthranilate synthase component I [Lachnospiraceae bacterium]
MYPTLLEVKEIAENREYKMIPVCTEIFSDIRTPVETLKILMGVSKHSYLLESAADNELWGRYTFLGYDPKLEITCLNGRMKIKDEVFFTNNPQEKIREVLNSYRSPKISNMPPFTGGLVGYFAYDYIKYSEPVLNLDANDSEGFNDVDLMLFDKVIAFDNFRQKIVLIVNIATDDVEKNYAEAEKELEKLIDLIKNGEVKEPEKGVLKSEIKPYFDKEQFCSMVEKAKYHIKEGDIFQIVLSNRLEADFEGSLLNTYRVLRTVNPSPYMFFFTSSDMEVAGASPETLVKLEDGVLHTFPLAGTRWRGKTKEEDEALEKELLQDEKELAEHNMLVDLGRNDLGKISKFGSVEVERYMDVLRFSHVMHIGSTVRGEIDDKHDALDAVDAVLPAGTLSGAPKIRACQLINNLEGNKRGIYGGAIGYIDFTGNLDLCIGIRLAYKKNNHVFVRSGGGIVADSVPENEYNESINKAAAVVKAIKEAQTEI